MHTKDAFCSFCGRAFAPPLSYPRRCSECGSETYANPIPVAVVIVPILDGIRQGALVIRRAIPPGIGRLALVGGFVDEAETWQSGGAREVREETGLSIDPAGLTPLWFTSTTPRPNRILLFARATAIPKTALPPFRGDSETSERGVVYGPDGLGDIFAFDLHALALRRHFEAEGVAGPHAFEPA